MKKQHILFLFPLLFLVSCGRIVKLSEEDYSWMPYKGNETLVFKSSTNETDTIFFIRKDTLWGLPYPALSTSKYEIAAIFCKHSDPYIGKNEHRYLENYFFEIKKMILLVAPHTSWKDILVGLATRSKLKIYKAKFLGKKELLSLIHISEPTRPY